MNLWQTFNLDNPISRVHAEMYGKSSFHLPPTPAPSHTLCIFDMAHKNLF